MSYFEQFFIYQNALFISCLKGVACLYSVYIIQLISYKFSNNCILSIKFTSYMSLSNIHDSQQFYLRFSAKTISDKMKNRSASTASSQSQRNQQDIADLKQDKSFQKVQSIINKNLTQVKDLGSTIGNSDKLLRITSSMLKILKNFELISNLKKFDRLSLQIGMTRRVFRFNRKYYTFKQIKNLVTNIFLNKSHTVTGMDIFHLVFQLFILVSDLNDLISYLMHLKILPNQKNPTFIKRTMNFYFFESIVWLALHIYQYVKMEIRKRNANKQSHFSKMESNVKAPSQHQLKTKRMTILKYICDSLTSHNDYSQRSWSLKPKSVSVIGMISSLVGIKMAWK